jgi:hypothetical protein
MVIGLPIDEGPRGAKVIIFMGLFAIVVGVFHLLIGTYKRNIQVYENGIVYSTEALTHLFWTEEFITNDSITSISIPEGGGPGRVLISYSKDGATTHIPWVHGDREILPLIHALWASVPEKCDETMGEVVDRPIDHRGEKATFIVGGPQVSWAADAFTPMAIIMLPPMIIFCLQFLPMLTAPPFITTPLGWSCVAVAVVGILSLTMVVTSLFMLLIIHEQQQYLARMKMKAELSEDRRRIEYPVPRWTGILNRVRPSIPVEDIQEVRRDPDLKMGFYLTTVKLWGGEKFKARDSVFRGLVGSNRFKADGWRLVNQTSKDTVPPPMVEIRWGLITPLLVGSVVLGCALWFLLW